MSGNDFQIFSALGWAVVHFLWQGVLLGGVFALLLSFLRGKSSQLRYLINCVGLSLCLLLFVGTIWQQMSVQEPAPDEAVYLEQAAEGIPSQASPLSDYSSVIAFLWLAGFSLMMIRYSRQGLQARSLRSQNTSKPDSRWETLFVSLKAILKISPRVRMLISHSVSTPMVVGCLKPVVLIPASALLSLSPDQLRAVLLHELAHIKRLDHWVNLFQNFIEAVLFFHPVVWWFSRSICIEREYCCDDLSVQLTDDPRDLAEALLHMETIRSDDSCYVLAASGGSLKERIARIVGISLNINPSTHRYPIMKTKNLGALFIALLLTAGGLYLANAAERLSREEVKERQREIKEAIKSGEISKEEGKKKFNALKDAYKQQKKATKSKFSDGDEDDEDLNELEEDLKKAVKSGKITEHEARQKLIKANSEKIHQEARRHQEHVRRKIELASKKILEAVESGEMSEEKGRAHLRELHKGAAEEARRVHQEVHERNVKLHLENAEHMLRRKVESGNLTEEQARRKLEGIRIQIKRNHARRQQLEQKVRNDVEEQGRRIKNAVESGELSREEAEAKFKEINRNAERRFKAEHQRAKEGDKSQHFYKYRKAIQEAVEEGKLDEEEAEEKLHAIHRKLWGDDDRDREDDDDDDDNKRRSGKGDDDDDDDRRGKKHGDDDDDKRKSKSDDDDDGDGKRRSGKGNGDKL